METKSIIINWQDIKSIRKAEKQKTKLENKGYRLCSETINYLIYIKE